MTICPFNHIDCKTCARRERNLAAGALSADYLAAIIKPTHTTTTHHICRADGNLTPGASADCKYCIAARAADEAMRTPPISRIGKKCECDVWVGGCTCGAIEPYKGAR